MDKVSILFQHEELIHKNIRFADAKAAIIVTANATLLSLLLRDDFKVWSGSDLLTTIALLTVVIGIVSGIHVVFPRSKTEDGKSTLVLPKSDEVFSKYKSSFAELSEADIDKSPFVEDLQKFIRQRASINRSKIRWVRRTILVSVIGWLLTLIASLSV